MTRSLFTCSILELSLTTGTLDPEIQTSRKLVSGKHTREYINIQKTYDLLSRTLVCHVPPNGLANKLFAARLIGEDLRQESNRENIGVTTRINNLLAAMHNQIELNCSVFQKFIEILQNYDQLEEILKILMGKLHECHSSQQLTTHGLNHRLVW